MSNQNPRPKANRPIKHLIDSQAVARFWAKVNRPAEVGACWLWTASKNKWGYGQMMLGGVPVRAARFSYVLHNEDTTLDVCHKCNVRACCNPQHLYAGTPKDNTRDRIVAGTTGKGKPRPEQQGEKHGGVKLAENQVIEILLSESSVSQLAQQFGVTKANISRIKNRRTWKHLDQQKVAKKGQTR